MKSLKGVLCTWSAESHLQCVGKWRAHAGFACNSVCQRSKYFDCHRVHYQGQIFFSNPPIVSWPATTLAIAAVSDWVSKHAWSIFSLFFILFFFFLSFCFWVLPNRRKVKKKMCLFFFYNKKMCIRFGAYTSWENIIEHILNFYLFMCAIMILSGSLNSLPRHTFVQTVRMCTCLDDVNYVHTCGFFLKKKACGFFKSIFLLTAHFFPKKKSGYICKNLLFSVQPFSRSL